MGSTGSVGREARSGDDDPGHPAGRLSIIALAGSVAVYALFAGTSPGRRADAEVLYRDLDWTWEWPARALATTVWPPLIVLAVLGLCWIALRDRRPADALRAVVLVAATLVLSRLVEEALKTLDPIGVEKARALGPGWYPSGHAAAAMSLGLAALLVSPPRLRTRALLLAAGVWPAMVGWAILADAGHHPSDVVGGVLLATAIAGALALGRRARVQAQCLLPWRAINLTIGALVATALLLAAVDGLRIPHSIFQPALILPGAAVAALVLGLVHAFDRALAGEAAGASGRLSAPGHAGSTARARSSC